MTPRATTRPWPRTRESAGPRHWRPIVLIAILGALGGCDVAGRATALGATVLDAGQGYVEEVVATRQDIRAECWRMLQNEVRALEGNGRYQEARQLLARAYPPLTIVQAIDERDGSAIARGLNEARPCLVEAADNPMASEPFVPSPLGPVLR